MEFLEDAKRQFGELILSELERIRQEIVKARTGLRTASAPSS